MSGKSQTACVVTDGIALDVSQETQVKLASIDSNFKPLGNMLSGQEDSGKNGNLSYRAPFTLFTHKKVSKVV